MHFKGREMRHYLRYWVRLLQIAVRLSILGFWIGILAIGSAEPNSYSGVNVSWHWARSPDNVLTRALPAC